MSAIYALLVGIAMGALLQRVRASSPGMILSNLRLENLSIIKFMATTIAVGMVLVYVVDAAAPQLLHFDIKPTYLIGVTLGGGIFGVGFALSGYCPGTCVVGASEGRRDALFAILGGVLGALAFTVLYTMMLEPLIKPLDLGKVRVQDYVHLPALAVALIFGGAMLAIVRLLPTTRGSSR